MIADGDEVFFLAARKDIRVVMKEMRREEAPARRVVIAGGGNIGVRLASEYWKTRIRSSSSSATASGRARFPSN